MNKSPRKKALRRVAIIVGAVVWLAFLVWVDMVVNFRLCLGSKCPQYEYVPVFFGGLAISFVIVMFKWMRSRTKQKGNHKNA